MSTKLPYQQDATVYINTGDSKLATLDEAISKSGFIMHLNQSFILSKKSREEYSIIIKANIMDATVAEDDAPAYTDPSLVEHLIDRIVEQGYKNIAVADAENLFNYRYAGRSVDEVANLIGYSRKNYRIVDLANEQIAYDYGSVLGNHTIAKPWHFAHYRISFGKNKTDWQCFYAGCLKNLYGCLPHWDRIKYYETKDIKFYEACVLLADQFPVHFGFLDAWVSGNGFAGSVKNPKINVTRTIISSPNILALDWVQGEKMNINPAFNFVIQEAMFRWGTVTIVRKGNMTPWTKWKNISFLTVGFWGLIESNHFLNKFFTKLFMSRIDKQFKKV